MVYTGQDLGMAAGFLDPFRTNSNFNAVRTGTAPATSAPTLVTISDDDGQLSAEGAGSNQFLTSPVDMDGTIIGPAGSVVTVLGTCTITNNTTGQTGTMAIIQIRDVNGQTGNHIAIGYASTITINAGESVTLGKWQGSPTTINYDDLIGAPICFASGTRIACPDGWRAIETLKPGDLVCTQAGLRPVLWRNARQVSATGMQAPIRVSAGVLNCERDLFVSPDHRLLLTGPMAQLLYDATAVWLRAADLVNDTTIRRQPCRFIAYHHLLLDGHFPLNAEGCAAESLDPLACEDRSLLTSIPAHLLARDYCRHPTLGALEARAASAYQGLWTSA